MTAPPRASATLALAVAALFGAGRCLADAAAAPQTPSARGGILSWVTSADAGERLAPGPAAAFATGRALPLVIDVDDAMRYQAFVGVGAAITDASAHVLTRDLDGPHRDALLQELFGPAPGLGLGFIRVTIGASDFSEHHYSLDDSPDGAPDPALSHFAPVTGEAPVLELVQRARALNPALKVVASPWSAPAWMKDSASLIKGHLKPEAYPAFADYLLRFADDYARAGVPLYALTIQNEPGFEPPSYPGMRFDAAERARFIAEALGPRLAARAQAPLLLDWDHNWDAPAQPLGVLADPAAARYVAGVAWHCYKGPVTAQGAVHDAHPDKDAYLTECSGGGWSPQWRSSLRWFVGTVMIESMRGWSRGAILWNLALDENSGPHLGGCPNCRGVVTVDSRTGEITRNVEYYALAHFSRFVHVGARRIESTSGVAGLRTVAFENEDDHSTVLVVCNDGDAATFTIRAHGRMAQYTLAGGSVATLTWNGER